jgi:hypothetical protein
MDINKKLTELIDGVNNGDIDTLADLQRELIYLRSEIQALRIHDVVGQSEQLVCDCKNCKPFPNHAAGFRKNKNCIKDKAN